jgi:hypothetical protein
MKNFQNKARIIKAGTALRTIAFAGLVLWAFTIVTLLGNAIVLPLILKQKFPFEVSLVLPVPKLVFAFMANLKIFRFFNRLKNGCLFDAQTVGNVDAAGTWWLMMWLYQLVWLTLQQSLYADKFDWSHVPIDWGWLFAGLTLKLFAWLFREAQELQEEQELTV